METNISTVFPKIKLYCFIAPNNQGTKATLICSKDNEESNPPYAQQTYKAIPNTEMETSLPSSTDSAQPSSDYEEAESGMSLKHSFILFTIRTILLLCPENVLNYLFMLLFFIHFFLCLF